MDSEALGRAGEKAAERYMKKNGYRILDRRWRCPEGELDLVAEKGGEVVFVEVKTRASEVFGGARLAVDARKASRLRVAAYAYLERHLLWESPFRIDVIAVTATPDSRTARLEHLVSAVDENVS
ncbi:MAG: YraN family protein [Patescibacteria group bacterium]|nr:YraN family protein [Patescibacteria group bacterium]